MFHTRIVTLVFLWSLAGCGCPMYLPGNANHGQAGRLDLAGQIDNLPVGVPNALEVRHLEEGTFECKDNLEWYYLNPNIDHRCRFIGTQHSVASVDSAQCREDKCSTSIVGTFVRVTPLVEGELVLEVTGTLDDGRATSDTFTLTAAKYDPLTIYCGDASRCPGPHAVLAGATFQWRAVANGLRPNWRQWVEVTEDAPSGVVELEHELGNTGSGAVTVRAVKPGVATLRFHDVSDGRDYSTTRTVRVAGLDELVRGELRLRSDTGNEVGGDYRRSDVVGDLLHLDIDVVGEALPAVVESESVPLVVTWLLTDGSLALGGAGLVSAQRGMVVAPTRPFPRGENAMPDLGGELVYFVGDAGTVALSATLGTAKLEQSFDYRYTRPALEACPAPTAKIADLTDWGDMIETRTLAWDSPYRIRTTQVMTVSFDHLSADVRLKQRCGPQWAVPGTMGNDFTVQLTTAGTYVFDAVDLAGHSAGYSLEVISVP